MNVLVVEPGTAPYEKEIRDGDLKAMQAIVGGLITAVYPYEDPVAIVCNDESLLRGMEFDRSVEGGYGGIFGPFFVCGLEEDHFSSLTAEQMDFFKRKFRKVEVLIGMKGNTPITIKVDPFPKMPPEQPQHPPKTPCR